MSKKILFLVPILFFLGTAVALATSTPTGTIVIDFRSPLGATDFDEMLTRILSWLWPISGAIAILMILIGAYYIILSGGSPEKVSTGKRIVVYALAGFGLITITTGIVALVRRILEI